MILQFGKFYTLVKRCIICYEVGGRRRRHARHEISAHIVSIDVDDCLLDMHPTLRAEARTRAIGCDLTVIINDIVFLVMHVCMFVLVIDYKEFMQRL